MLPAFVFIAVLLPSISWGGDTTCEDLIPKTVDASICDDIRSAMFIFRYAVRDIDEKVKETVLTALKETQRILDSTLATAISDVRGVFSDTSRRRRAVPDLKTEVHALAESAADNIEAAVSTAGKKIRSSITHAVFNVDIKNDKIKNEALNLLRKVLNKRSITRENELRRRDIHVDVKQALSAASDDVTVAMEEAVTTSIKEHKRIVDFFAPRLKEFFKRANFKGNVDQAEQDIEALSIKSSFNFIKYYDSSTTVAIGKAIKTVEGLLVKLNKIEGNDPTVLYVMKVLLEAAGTSVSEVVVETNNDRDHVLRGTILAAAEKMLKDYETIEEILKKNGV